MVLAQALRDCCVPLFLLDPADCWSRDHLSGLGCNFFDKGFDRVWSFLQEPNAILTDTRETEGLEDLIAWAKIRRIPVISIHDLGLNLLPSDIVIDGSIAPAYPVPNATCFNGTDYMILDPAYRSFHQKEKPIAEKIGSIFVNLGGGDSGRYYPKVLEGLKLWAHSVEVIGVPGFASWGQESQAKKDWSPLRFHWESRSIERLLFQADLAITAGGIAAYEALCTGTPLLALSYDPHQQTTLAMLAGSGACVDLGPGDTLDPAGLPEMLSLVESDRERRKLLSCRGKQIVDGLGAERVAQVIRRIVRERSVTGG